MNGTNEGNLLVFFFLNEKCGSFSANGLKYIASK